MAMRMGNYCRMMQLQPDLFLISPAVRTRETYEAMAFDAEHRCDVAFDPALYNATSTTIRELIAATRSDHNVILVVGHNPGIAESAIAFSGSGDRAMLAEMRKHFPAPAMAVIDFQVAAWADIKAGQGQLDRFVTKTILADQTD